MEKIFSQKSVVHFVGTSLGRRLFFFSSSSRQGLNSLILFPSFAAGDIDTDGKFTSSVIDTSGNLPTVSTRPGVPVAKFAAGGVDPGVIDTGDVT